MDDDDTPGSATSDVKKLAEIYNGHTGVGHGTYNTSTKTF